MDKKEVITIVIVVLAIVAAYFIIFSPLAARYYPEGFPVDRSEFLPALSEASKVYIVMDIRHAAPAVQRNILQCGVDFAGSEGLVEKEIITHAIDNDRCVTLNNASRYIEDCLNEIRDEIVLYIQQGDQTVFYPHAALVGIGEDYRLYDCRINIV